MYVSSSIARRHTMGLLTALLLGFVLTFTACTKDDNPVTTVQSQTITQTVGSNASFTLLNAALTKAGLGATLSGTGPFTVFAPTDDAFRAAGFADVNAINNASGATLTTLNNVLLYHVVSGTAIAGSTFQTAASLSVPTSASGSAPLYVTKASSGTVSVNNAYVRQADVQATNGVIHVIDQVLMPPAGNILAVAQGDTSLSLLTAAALRGGALVTGALSSTTTALTVFAPTNAAFRAAGFPTAAAINAAPEAQLTAVLTNHVLANARAFSPTLATGPVTTFGGGSVTATVGANNSITLLSKGNGANVSNVLSNTVVNGTLVRNRDINATNGVIHKIDRVLLP